MSIFSKKQTKKVVVNAENHGYKPDTITFKQGKPAQLKFIPSDNMGCMNEVVFKDLNIDGLLLSQPQSLWQSLHFLTGKVLLLLSKSIVLI